MERTIFPHKLGGRIAAIPSKSQAHRLLICAALADEPTALTCPEDSQDIEATARCLTAFGAAIRRTETGYAVQSAQAPERAEADCGESGSTLRFLLPVAAALGIDTTFRLHGRLAARPLSPLWEELEAHGCALSRPTPDTVRCTGRLTGGVFRLAGNISSQFISGLLLALPLTGADSELVLTTPLESAGYVDMTLDALRADGIDLTGYWYNPNIHPFTEYRARRNCLQEYAKTIELPLLVRDDYGLRPFVREVADDIAGRCVKCYEMRLFEAARAAKEGGFDAFTSSLFISPYQKHELMRDVACRAAEEYGVEFYYQDFRPMFRDGQARARELGFYMQKYCGCVFSEQERYQKPSRIIP